MENPTSNSDIQTPNYHLIGIGGSGMSGLARILKAGGKIVTGSNDQANRTTDTLIQEGIRINIGHAAKNVAPETAAVVYSSAVPFDNIERREAEKRGIPQYSYPEAVGFLTKEKKTICIAGTHGKTTTTALLASAFLKTGQDPTIIVGSTIRELEGKNARHGRGDHFILESCEYRRAFLHFHPRAIVISNIEADHLDYYRDLEDYLEAFKEFTLKLPAYEGLLVLNADDANTKKLWQSVARAAEEKQLQIVWYGTDARADYQLRGNAVYHRGTKLATLKLQIPGQHNLMNATAAIALLHTLKLPLDPSLQALQSYAGSARRFEKRGNLGKATIIDDYAHHPTEIRATLKAARQKFGPEAKILCVFQPHQHSRTLKLLEDFARAFADADEVIIPDIYQVRDSQEDIEAVSARKLVEKIRQYHSNVSEGESLETTARIVKQKAADFNAILTLGAGDIEKLPKILTKK